LGQWWLAQQQRAIAAPTAFRINGTPSVVVSMSECYTAVIAASRTFSSADFKAR